MKFVLAVLGMVVDGVWHFCFHTLFWQENCSMPQVQFQYRHRTFPTRICSSREKLHWSASWKQRHLQLRRFGMRIETLPAAWLGCPLKECWQKWWNSHGNGFTTKWCCWEKCWRLRYICWDEETPLIHANNQESGGAYQPGLWKASSTTWAGCTGNAWEVRSWRWHEIIKVGIGIGLRHVICSSSSRRRSTRRRRSSVHCMTPWKFNAGYSFIWPWVEPTNCRNTYTLLRPMRNWSKAPVAGESVELSARPVER